MTAPWCSDNLRDIRAWTECKLPVTTKSDQSAKEYDAAVRQVASYVDCERLGGIKATCERMLAADKDFILGRSFLYGLECLGSGKAKRTDASFAKNVDDLVNDAHNSDVSERELRHVLAVKALADGHMDKCAQLWESILRVHPTDLHALKFVATAHLFLGNIPEIRDTVARVLPFWDPQMPLYSLLKGMLAYGLEENEQYAEAERTALEALNLNRNDAWATHALAHVMEMNGRYLEAIQMLTDTENDWKPFNHLACHNYWHLAVFHIQNQDHPSALSIFDSEIRQRIQSKAMFPIVDACSLLYRLQLEDVNVGSNRWESVFDVCQGYRHDHAQAYNDTMMTMTFLGVKDQQVLEEHRQSMKDYARCLQNSRWI